MTYRELLKQLLGLTVEQLDMDITIYMNDEYYPVSKLEFCEELDVLDVNHPFLVTEVVTDE